MSLRRLSLPLLILFATSCGHSHVAHDAASDGTAADASKAGATDGGGGSDGASAQGDGDAGVDAPSDVARDGSEGGSPDLGDDRPDGATDASVDRDDRPDGATDASVDATGDVGAEAPPPASGSPYRALAITTGALHTCAILDNHRVKCWGVSDYGELGLGDTKTRGRIASEMGDALPFVDLGAGRTATAISAGRYLTCAILDTGRVKCWGWAGLTGLPIDAAIGNHGDGPGEMGDALPALDLGDHKARLVAAGYAESCAALDDDSVWCWGEGPVPPTKVSLGTTSRVVQLSPNGYGIAARVEDGGVRNVVPANANPINLGSKAIHIAGARTSLCAVLDDSTSSCTGGSGGGRPPASAASLVQLEIGELGFSCGLSAGGGVRCWGGAPCVGQAPGSTYWCLGPRGGDGGSVVGIGEPVADLPTAGRTHACARLASGSVRCWEMMGSFCSGDGGASTPCDVPATGDLSPILGASVQIVTTATGRQFGAWRDIDLGKHP